MGADEVDGEAPGSGGVLRTVPGTDAAAGDAWLRLGHDACAGLGRLRAARTDYTLAGNRAN